MTVKLNTFFLFIVFHSTKKTIGTMKKWRGKYKDEKELSPRFFIGHGFSFLFYTLILYY
jgi:hypothetical protein